MGQIIELVLRPDVTVIAVLVPLETHNFKVIGSELFWNESDPPCVDSEQLPPGQYEIVGLLREAKVLELAKMLTNYIEKTSHVTTYRIGDITCFHPRTAMKLIIEEAGGDPEANWLIIKKIQ